MLKHMNCNLWRGWRDWRNAACALLIVQGAAAAFAADPVLRYACTFGDGQVRVVARNIELMGDRSVVCRAMVAAEAAPQLMPLPPVLPPLMPEVRLSLGADRGRTRGGPRMPIAPAELSVLIREASHRQQLDPDVVTALMYTESRFQSHARSPKGALGLMQIMPATGARYGVTTESRLMEPAINIEVGTRYLRDLSDMFDGRLDLVLAAYNAGENAVTRWGYAIPPYAETRDYVQKIMAALGAGPRAGGRP
ncbi:lytic transglycosylase domain-containing protein [Aquincola sp. S2]|uniref:Lytic transglycosylase domain-containing protein n=2 Tax=Pseudaquabacterium terrae TaxID=2732868 RepID=A0ABX2EUW4_9BURK|nr:lytic transglycosylase domain-containing protein [Aquabacterium terrae]